MSDVKAAELGITPLARIVSTGVTRAVPGDHGPRAGGGVPAGAAPGRDGDRATSTWWRSTRRSRPRSSRPTRDLGIDLAKLNVNGGAIAVGHPFGMTGARITTTLLNSLQFHDETHRPGDHVRRRRPGHGDDLRAAQLKPFGWSLAGNGSIRKGLARGLSGGRSVRHSRTRGVHLEVPIVADPLTESAQEASSRASRSLPAATSLSGSEPRIRPRVPPPRRTSALARRRARPLPRLRLRDRARVRDAPPHQAQRMTGS